MSCYMIDREHVRFLVSAARRYARNGCFGWVVGGKWEGFDGASQDKASDLGSMLWLENIASVEGRYPDTKGKSERMPGRIDETYIYSHSKDWPSDMIDAVQVLKSAACYRYQACEHEGWEASESASFIRALISSAIESLPGYDKAKWGAPELPVRPGARL